MTIKTNSLKPTEPLAEFIIEHTAPESDSRYTRALELKKELSGQLDELTMEQVDTIVTNVILGPQKTERTEREQETGKARQEMKELIIAQSRRTELDAIEEIVRQAETIGLSANEAEDIVKTIVEYAKLVYRLNAN